MYVGAVSIGNGLSMFAFHVGVWIFSVCVLFWVFVHGVRMHVCVIAVLLVGVCCPIVGPNIYNQIKVISDALCLFMTFLGRGGGWSFVSDTVELSTVQSQILPD